jgi:predicted nucleotidyltransferase
MPDTNLKKLGKYLDSRPDVICAVVFGSAQSGKVNPGSDLDVGIYFTARPKGEYYIQLLVEMAEAAEFDVIDLVDLNSADPILAFEALSGNFICRSDPDKTAVLTSRVCREYEDTMYRLNCAA